MATPLPVTGAWRPGDPPGQRRFFTFPHDRPFALDTGTTLSDVTIAYETWGRLDATAGNAVLICHALNASHHVAGVYEGRKLDPAGAAGCPLRRRMPAGPAAAGGADFAYIRLFEYIHVLPLPDAAMSVPEVESFFEPFTETWSHLLIAPEGCCAILDPVLDYDYRSGRTGTASAGRIAARVRERGLTVEWILETHVHADHLSAGDHLRRTLGGRLAIGEHVCEVQQRFARLYGAGADFRSDGSQFDQLFTDGERFRLGSLEIEVLHGPGHTPACVAYRVGPVVFVGDLIFMPDVGTARCDFPGGSARALYRSVRRILDLPPEHPAYVIYTSGSTGTPKGVLVGHAGLCGMLDAQIAAFGLGPGCRGLLYLSISFDASLSDIGTVLLSGASLWIDDDVATPAQLRAPLVVDVPDAEREAPGAVAVERGLEGEVEAVECLGRREAGGLERDRDPAALAGGMLLGQQAVDGLERGELAALDPAHGVVEGLQGPGHAQADQARTDPVQRLAHDAALSPARRRATAS